MQSVASSKVADDSALVAACRAGDRVALERMFSMHSPQLSRFLRRLVGPGTDADDLLQNTLIAAVKAFPAYRGESTVARWLCGIAAAVVRDHFRRPDRRRIVALDEAGLEKQASEAWRESQLAAEDRQQLSRIHDLLNRIDADKRLAFVLHVVEGHSIDEVAVMTGTSTSATKSRIFWARKFLFERARRDPELRALMKPLPDTAWEQGKSGGCG